MPTSANASTSAGISSRAAPKRQPAAPQAIAETSISTGPGRGGARPGRLLEQLLVAFGARDQPGLERLPRERAEAAADGGQRCDGRAHSPRAARRMTSSGGSQPVQRSNDRAPCRTSSSRPSTSGRPAASATSASGVGEPSAR